MFKKRREVKKMVYHKPALLNASVEGLAIKPDGRYVDVTFGGGGHSREILKSLSDEGRLFAFDQDADAAQNAIDDERFVLIPQNFAFLKNFLRYHKAIPVDGVLADLGVSFHQFDVAERGFSFRFAALLDMRMNQKSEMTAAKVLNTYELEALTSLFRDYGELKNAYKLAEAIVKHREERPLKTIDDLKLAVVEFTPKQMEHKFYAQLFQAIRVEVNDELGALKKLLEQALEVLEVGGRLAVITYHSIEDRLVKNFFRTGNFEGKVEKDFYGKLIRPLEPINRKPIVPNEEEIKANNRARSAKLRIAEKAA